MKESDTVYNTVELQSELIQNYVYNKDMRVRYILKLSTFVQL